MITVAASDPILLAVAHGGLALASRDRASTRLTIGPAPLPRKVVSGLPPLSVVPDRAVSVGSHSAGPRRQSPRANCAPSLGGALAPRLRKVAA